MKLKYLAIGLALLVIVLMIAPMLVPMSTYRDQVQQLASEKLGAPVKIDVLHMALLPSPRVKIEGIAIGQNAEIQLGEMEAVLDVTTLFDAVRVISRLEIERPVIKSSAIALLKPLVAQKNEAGTVVIRRITLKQARLEWPGMTLPMMNAEIGMNDAGLLQQGVLTSEDGKLTIEARPQGAGYSANIEARQWISPMGPAFRFDSLTAKLDYSDQGLDIPSLEAVLYGGKLNAVAHLDWKKSWLFNGKFKTDGIEMGEASRLLSKNVSISGRISGSGVFSSSAKASDQLAEKLTLDYGFSVMKGVLHGIDLVQAASLFVKQTGQGGETQFDELSGKLHTTGKQIELRDMKVASGLLAGNGAVRIAPAKTLHGRVDVELKKGLALVTVPLNVSGTVDAPVVMPTKAAIAGAVAGTAILGPMGTGVGMKAGALLDKMFGDQE